MITNNLTSLLIPSQLPEHIRDDPSYETFVSFIQAYYQWMEQQGNITETSKNLLKYDDIDQSSHEFLQYFYKDFLSNFPTEILADKNQVVKLAKELYKSKGTPASYKFLFRILYDLDVDIFLNSDAVLKPSSGTWYIPKSLKVATDLIYVSGIQYTGNVITIQTPVPTHLTIGDTFTIDSITAQQYPPNGSYNVSAIQSTTSFSYIANITPEGTLGFSGSSIYIPHGFANINFLKTNNLRIFGETTQSIATIESSIVVGNRIELFISNIERLFNSGEYVRVVDSDNQDVLLESNAYQPLRAKILGQISKITIDNRFVGSTYRTGDPVVLFGGLNSSAGIGASAEVGVVSAGAIQKINVVNGGHGFTQSVNDNITGHANTEIDIIDGGGAIASVGSLNPDIGGVANVSFIPLDTIGDKENIRLDATQYPFQNNIHANSNTSLANSFLFTSFVTYPISSIIVGLGGIGLSHVPEIQARTLYNTANNLFRSDLGSLGILAPITITSGGVGYVVNDVINIIGGSGYHAYANVTSVSSTGAVTSVSYVHGAEKYTSLGGMGYTQSGLPTLTISSTNINAANAVLSVPSILGYGEIFSTTVDQIGNIFSINMLSFGEDYISAPKVSLQVQDITVVGLSPTQVLNNGDVIYQTSNNATSYSATVDSVKLLVNNFTENTSIYNVRVFNYNSQPNASIPLQVSSSNVISMMMSSGYNTISPDTRRNIDGVLNYGDGTARASASFLNGLTISDGMYIDSTGQPSSFDVIQNENYNSYTYTLTLEKEIAKYRETLLNLVHPTGMKVVGRCTMTSNNSINLLINDSLYDGYPLSHHTGLATGFGKMSSDFVTLSSNTIIFEQISTANIASFIQPGSIIQLSSDRTESIKSEVTSVIAPSTIEDLMAETGIEDLSTEAPTVDLQSINQLITIKDNVWLTFPNVAYVSGSSNSKTLNVGHITNSYDIINNGNYGNTRNHLEDIVGIGDIILTSNTQYIIQSIDFTKNIITLTTNLTSTFSNTLMSINRTLTSGANGHQFLVWNPTGI